MRTDHGRHGSEPDRPPGPAREGSPRAGRWTEQQISQSDLFACLSSTGVGILMLGMLFVLGTVATRPLGVTLIVLGGSVTSFFWQRAMQVLRNNER